MDFVKEVFLALPLCSVKPIRSGGGGGKIGLGESPTERKAYLEGKSCATRSEYRKEPVVTDKPLKNGRSLSLLAQSCRIF